MLLFEDPRLDRDLTVLTYRAAGKRLKMCAGRIKHSVVRLA